MAILLHPAPGHAYLQAMHALLDGLHVPGFHADPETAVPQPKPAPGLLRRAFHILGEPDFAPEGHPGEWEIRRARHELEGMTDRELADIGISRGTIESAVRYSRDRQGD